jgi:hypothetical protein
MKRLMKVGSDYFMKTKIITFVWTTIMFILLNIIVSWKSIAWDALTFVKIIAPAVLFGIIMSFLFNKKDGKADKS